MIELVSHALGYSELLTLFLLILIGYLVGTITVRGVSFGPGGIFLVALLFGHVGVTLPREVMEIGLVLFVYAIGIQVGPRFVRMFKKDGIKFAFVAFSMVSIAALMTIGAARVLGLPPDLASGLFSGAITNTPAMAAATDMIIKFNLGDGANVTAGYAISYPFAIVLAVLFVQVLPGLLRRTPRTEEEEWVEQERAMQAGLAIFHFRVENPNCMRVPIETLHPGHLVPYTISRVRRGEIVHAVKPELMLEQGDIVTVVASEDECDTLALFFGPMTSVPLTAEHVRSDDVEVVSSAFVGKRLKDLDVWHAYGVTLTRVSRQGFELTPHGETLLEEGDVLRVVGEREDVERFVKAVGIKDDKVHETHFAPFLLGLVFGLLIGIIPIPLIPGSPIVLGAAGGALIAGLLFSHVKRVGSLELHVPQAAVMIIRELGLMLFLAGAGLVAGSRFARVFATHGLTLLVAGAVITIGTLAAGVLIMRMFRFNILAVNAALAAGMTQPAVLAAARAQGRTDLVTLVYASVYPFSMIFKIVLVQVLVYVLRMVA